MEPTAPAPRPVLLIGVFATSAALLSTELALTRVLSVTVWYHFAFFAISVALLGTGAAGLVVHRFARRLGERHLPVWSLGQALATLAVAPLLVRMTPDWFGGDGGVFTVFTPRLLLLFALTTLPFFCGGVVLALLTMRFSAYAHRVYFVDLAGAAAACVGALGLLSWLPGPAALVASGMFASGAAWLFAGARQRAGRPLLAATCLVLVAQAAIIGSPWLALRAAKGVDLERTPPELARWSASSLVSVFDFTGFPGWGLSPRYDGPIPEQKTVVIDMNALTPLIRFDGDFAEVRIVQHDLSSIVYRVRPRPRRVCVIGAGGGKDVLAALAFGAQRVTAVEINRVLVDEVVRGAYREFTGDLYRRADVDVHVEDGRGFLERSRERYDVILISMVDTSAATAAGAYALTENGLYTVEAFERYFERLAPGGVLSVSTVSLPGLSVGARLVSTARAALAARRRPAANAIAVLRTAWVQHPDAVLYDVLVKPDGFGAGESRVLVRAARDLGFVTTVAPWSSSAAVLAEERLVARIVNAPDASALDAELRAQKVDVSAARDDRPFFFYQNRVRDFLPALAPGPSSHLYGNGLRILSKVLVLSLVMLFVCLVLPLSWSSRQASAGGGLALDLSYMVCLGVGFMCVEIALLHRLTLFLGEPTYALAAVLCVLLVGSSLGARLLGARAARGARAAWLMLGLAGLLLAGPYVLDAVIDGARRWPPGARAWVAGALVLGVAPLLGVPLPARLLRVAESDSRRVAWLLGVNGAASVLGTIVATLVALHAGLRALFCVAAALYLAAALLWLALGRAARLRV